MNTQHLEKHYGFTLCTSGTATRLIAGNVVTFAKGDLMLLSPAIPLVELERSPDYKEYSLTEHMDILSSLVLPHITSLIEKGYLKTPYIRISASEQSRFVEFAEMIRFEEQRSEDVKKEESVIIRQIVTLKRCQHIMETVLLMMHQAPSKKTIYSKREEITSAFLTVLSREFATHRSVAHYAEQACLTQRYFSKLIKEQTGKSPMEWTVLVTISQAKNLLKQPDLQIKEVAQSLGFPEQFTFRKYFKKHTGMSPSEFRRCR